MNSPASPFTAKVLDTCRAHFAKDCRGCPLMAPCHAPVAPLTRENIDKHTARLNAAAETSK